MFNFQSIGNQTCKCLIFANFLKKVTPTKNEKIGKKISFPKSDEDR